MDKGHFDQLVKAVRQMNRHMAGKVVRGAKSTELAEPDVRAIRETAKICQSQFANLVGVNLRTLPNREQRRTRPSGPARVLLKIVALDPKAAAEPLHGSERMSVDAPCPSAILLISASCSPFTDHHSRRFVRSPFAISCSPWALSVHHLPFAVHRRVYR